MISTPDRQDAIQLIDEARAKGARPQAACNELGIGTNTYRRWARGNQDRRPEAERPVLSHALTPEERQRVLEICHRPEFASLPPGQIVPRLSDEEGIYVAYECNQAASRIAPATHVFGVSKGYGFPPITWPTPNSPSRQPNRNQSCWCAVCMHAWQLPHAALDHSLGRAAETELTNSPRSTASTGDSRAPL